jgi:hypothetical protein
VAVRFSRLDGHADCHADQAGLWADSRYWEQAAKNWTAAASPDENPDRCQHQHLDWLASTCKPASRGREAMC